MIKFTCEKTEEGINFWIDKQYMPMRTYHLFLHKDDFNDFLNNKDNSIKIVLKNAEDYIHKTYPETND